MAVYTGNRGRSLEEFITYANRRYRSSGQGIIEKQHTHFIPIRDRTGRVCSVKVEEKATVDFMGRIGSTPVAIEAKHTKQKSIRFDAVQDHQAAFLDDFVRKGAGIGLVLVSFNLDAFYAIPWAFWREARNAWRQVPKEKRKVTIEGTTWITPGKASVKQEELLPEWKVEVGGTIGLDYLAKYIKRG